jgi:uncharacterized membrane protein YphA (DoxX/SURF4 family)
MSSITKTKNHKIAILPRLIAGLPLLGFGMLHFAKPEHFQEILIASGIPMVEMNLYVAPLVEVVGGILLLLGLFARVGGVFGIATMGVAILSTKVLAGMTVENLPGGLTQVPHVPPLPLPVLVMVASLVILIIGGGCWSLDRRNSSSDA